MAFRQTSTCYRWMIRSSSFSGTAGGTVVPLATLAKPAMLTGSPRSAATTAFDSTQSSTPSSSSHSSAMMTTRSTLVAATGPCVQGSGIGTDVEMIAANDRILTRSSSSSSTHLRTSRLFHSPQPTTTTRATTHRCFATKAAATTQPDNNNNTTSSSSSSSSSSPTAAMKDEYGAMDDSGDTYVYPGDFLLESNQILPNAQLRYKTYGTLNEHTRDNVLVICHALTGNASLHAWWGDLLGPQKAFDTTKYLVVCCNILGSCYGSTGPVSIDPRTGQPYGKDFPDISVKDTVRLQLLMLQNQLNISSIKAVIGGSFGGMQAVEFAVQAGIPTPLGGDFSNATTGGPFVRSVIPIACGAQHTAWQIAISEVQRQAIYRDPHWDGPNPFAATAGLEVARQLGMVSYRTPAGFCAKFGRDLVGDDNNNTIPQYGSNAPWQVKSYLRYQGVKFLTRFDPVTYVKMTEQMDSHQVTRGRPRDILSRVEIPALVLGIDSDILYPLREQEELARQLPHAELRIIHSQDGHDGFLLEQEQVAAHIIDFLDRYE